MKDTLREECDDSDDCLENCCINQVCLNLKMTQYRALQSKVFRSLVLCRVRAAGPVCAGQCRGGSSHETPGGDSQAGEHY